MNLRKLEFRDAERMLQWMHDYQTTEFLNTDFETKTLSDCESFISAANDGTKNLHLAVVDELDEYMGTVSLKNINIEEKIAEFAITMHPDAQGNGLAGRAMKCILDMGISKRYLESIYWCVDPLNARAVRFYDKNGYKRTIEIPNSVRSLYINPDRYIWYVYSGT
ncbi:GNAT family N-acetyltransferase [uncultured Faecalibaculum sp.]|uniref:GNAT family N-acetyltransferase n=1 Tax=uncultured Faecalibaculum sp. TaxID=1729681 RepID=UPI00272E75BC|nr:GNAT family N-acetyltransferase [uncultured Faecalibaculum sp.]